LDLELRGKRALVTGSSSGIGAGIARLLAQEGAAVVVHGRNKERTLAIAEELRRGGAIATAVMGDLSTDHGAAAVAEAVLA
jgi:3-oxoacyl-[acyl-carrier protein] reductase